MFQELSIDYGKYQSKNSYTQKIMQHIHLLMCPNRPQNKMDREYTFLFKLQIKNITIKMRIVITCVFSGKLLTHHQTCNCLCTIKEGLFSNFGSYGTSCLFSHIRTSFNRNTAK